MQRKLIMIIGIIALLAFVMMGASECDPDAGDKAHKKEEAAQGNNYSSLQEKQPASSMSYSPTREGLNKWMKTWEEPNKISYVYLIASNGQKVGYYVFDGLPVSYCASLTPPDEISRYGAEGSAVTQAPSMDGVYYSGSQCSQYFGYDATTGTYIEFSIGSGLNFLVTDQPLPLDDVEPLGFTKIGDK